MIQITTKDAYLLLSLAKEALIKNIDDDAPIDTQTILEINKVIKRLNKKIS